LPLQDQLRELYRIDQRVRTLRGRLDAASRRAEAQKKKLAQLQQQKTELADQLRQTQARVAGLESEAAGAEQKIEKLRGQMNSVRSNKEYSALLVEVNTLKLEKSKVEDQALTQMTEVEQIQQRSAELDEKTAQQARLVEMAEAEVREAREEVGDRLSEVEAQREEAASTVPDDARALFDKLADEYDGEAVALIQEENRKRMEYICGGCFIGLPVEIVNALMSRRDELVTCPTCHRILAIDQELSSAIGSK